MADAPKWFKPVAIVALLWNLLGCAAFLSDVMMKPEDIAKLSPERKALYEARPAWAVGATAIAVGGGALVAWRSSCAKAGLSSSWASPSLE